MNRLKEIQEKWLPFEGNIDRKEFIFSTVIFGFVAAFTAFIIFVLTTISGAAFNIGFVIRLANYFISSEIITMLAGVTVLLPIICGIASAALILLFIPAVVVVMSSFVVRRLHDMRLSGYFILLFLIPIPYVWILLIILLSCVPALPIKKKTTDVEADIEMK